MIQPIDPELVTPIEDPPLRGPTYRDLVERSIKQSEVIRRWNCRGLALMRRALPEECVR